MKLSASQAAAVLREFKKPVFHYITDPRAENAKAADGRECYRQLFKAPFTYEAHAEQADGSMAAAQKMKIQHAKAQKAAYEAVVLRVIGDCLQLLKRAT